MYTRGFNRFLFLLSFLIVGCSEEEVSRSVADEESGAIEEGFASAEEVLLPDEFLLEKQLEGAKVLGTQHRFEVALEGLWIANKGNAKLNIAPSETKFVFQVKGEFENNAGHPPSFPFDVRHPFFDFGGRVYRIYFEGKHPSALDLLWKDANKDSFEENMNFIRFTRFDN
jgi:hypothetical protein